MVIRAIYENGMLRLLEQVDLQEGQEVTVTIPKDTLLDEVHRQEAVALLQSWLDVDEEEAAEQRETLEYLKKALDEDRTSNRKFFPDANDLS